MIDDIILEEYIRNNKNISSDIVREVLAIYIPSIKQLFRVLRKNGIFIDTQDKSLKEFVQKCYYLTNEKKFTKEERLNYFGINKINDRIDKLEKRIKMIEDKKIQVGDKVYSSDEAFGYGTVVTLHSHDLMMVKFDKRPLNTMCSSSNMVTVHDDIKRKLTRV